MKTIFFSLLVWLTLLWYFKYYYAPIVKQSQIVIYPHIFYNLTGKSIKIFTWYNNYNNVIMKTWYIYFLWNKNMYNKYNWKNINNLNVDDYNKLSNLDYKYYNYTWNLIFKK